MAQSSYNTTLSHATTSAGPFEKLCDIKDFPDLGGDPEMLETTTLSDAAQTYIKGIQSMDALTFTANYDKTEYKKIKALDDGKQHYFQVKFGVGTADTADDSIFEWQGQLTVYVTGAGVNEVVEMVIVISPSTVITLKEDE